MNVYTTTFAVAVITEDPQDVTRADRSVSAAIGSVGGSAVVFVADTQPVDAADTIDVTFSPTAAVASTGTVTTTSNAVYSCPVAGVDDYCPAVARRLPLGRRAFVGCVRLIRAWLTKGYSSGCSIDSTARSTSRSGQYK